MGLAGVVDLEFPEAAYTTGKSPSHARVENLHDCYRGVGRGDVLALLSAGGMLRERVNGGRVQRMIPTQDAVDAGLAFRCGGVALWSVDAVAAWARKNAGISLVEGDPEEGWRLVDWNEGEWNSTHSTGRPSSV